MEKKITVRLNDKNEVDAKVWEILASVSNASEYIKAAVLAVSESSAVEVYLTGLIRKIVEEGNLQVPNLNTEKPGKTKQSARANKSVKPVQEIQEDNDPDDLELDADDAMELLGYMDVV